MTDPLAGLKFGLCKRGRESTGVSDPVGPAGKAKDRPLPEFFVGDFFGRGFGSGLAFEAGEGFF